MPEAVITFGGGVNARKRILDVKIDECVPRSFNFDLDPQYRALNRRKPFDLLGTAPNGGSIRGFAQLVRSDGTVSTIVQAGSEVYRWDGSTGFTLVASINSGARLRGPREHNFTISDYVIVTDLEKVETVKIWDGTTLAPLNHDLGSNFYAKYCRVAMQRAFFANVKTTTDTPQVILASQIDDAETLSDVNTPTRALGEDAPFFLVTPDLRAVNGMEEAFGEIVVSSDRGRLFRFSGEDSFDFEITGFHAGSAVIGDEAIKNIGNDILFGSPGRIESAVGILEFGDVETNDVSRDISSLVDDVTGWTIEYDRTRQKVFCFPNTTSTVYVLHKKVHDDNKRLDQNDRISPWSIWTTTHPMDFNPVTVMLMIDPLNSRDTVYMGDSSGNIYRMDGTGGQDGGTTDITVQRTSGLLAPGQGNAFDISGWISYRRLFQGTVDLTIIGGGVAEYDQDISIRLPAASGVAVYNGNSYYGGGSYYGQSFTGRLIEQNWRAAGHSSHFQVRVSHTGSGDINIEEIGIRFEEAQT